MDRIVFLPPTKVIFSGMSVCPHCGRHVTINHDDLDLTIQVPPPPILSSEPHTRTHFWHLARDIWWSRHESCSNLQIPWCWYLVIGYLSRQYASYLNAFLFFKILSVRNRVQITQHFYTMLFVQYMLINEIYFKYVFMRRVLVAHGYQSTALPLVPILKLAST